MGWPEASSENTAMAPLGPLDHVQNPVVFRGYKSTMYNIDAGRLSDST